MKMQLYILKKKKSYIHVIHNNNFFSTITIRDRVFFLKNLNILNFNYLILLNYKNIEFNLKKFFYTWEFLFFNKFIFQGKGFKIKKKKKNFIFAFNKSNIEFLKNNNYIIIKKISKQKFVNIYIKLEKTFNLKLKRIRNINIFTKRGLRLSKELILKKTGKKNTNN